MDIYPYSSPGNPELAVSTAARTATVGGVELSLTKMEFDALLILSENAGGWVPYSRFEEFIWGYDVDLERNQIHHLVFRLRAKLAAYGLGQIIRCRRGEGYRMARLKN